LAERAQADPVAFRLRHLTHARLIDVLKASAKAANWEVSPSPKARTNKTGVVNGRGIACVA
jgi:nicotinate dehydrogenase subunit B